MHDYVTPDENESSFTCPHCGAFSLFLPFYVHELAKTGVVSDSTVIQDLSMQKCFGCGGKLLWLDGRLIYPLVSSAPLANPDLPDDIRADFEEARQIAARSSRGAAALLRLCIDKLTTEAGARGKTLDERIGDLVKNGLDVRIQKMLDSVRVIGNESVHPGQIDLRDDPDLAASLFRLVNEIADELISRPRRIEGIYDRIPEGKRAAIERRDGKAPAST